MSRHDESDATFRRNLPPHLRFIDTWYELLCKPTLIISMPFCLPVVGNFLGIAFSNVLGCPSSAGQFTYCPIFGYDISEAANAYAISFYFLGVFNFAIYYKILTALFPQFFVNAWIFLTIYLAIARYIYRDRLRPGSKHSLP